MRPDRSGFVLPTTLLVMTLLTVMLTAAFTLVSAEYRTTDNSAAITRAQAIAEAGLQSYLSLNRNLTGTTDSIRVTLTGGYADVVARRLRDSTTTRRAIWLIRSSGYAADPILIGQLQARRTIAQVAERHRAQFPAEGALLAPNGVHIVGAGGNNPITGSDASCGGVRPRIGLLIPSPIGTYYTETSPGDPDPAGTPVGILTAPSASAAIDSTHIDWPALVGGNFTPDYSIPPGPPSWTSQAVYFRNGNYTLGAFGTPTMYGILVVTGNLTLVGDGHWHGLIIVGGYVATSGPFRVHGMMISGMNIALGQAVPPDTILRAGVALQWRSCEFDPAVSNLASTAPRRGTWVNTWSMY